MARAVTRKQLARLVETWRRKLTPEWRVILMTEPPPDHEGDDFWAISQTKNDYTEVCLYFTDGCLARGAAEVEITVVHELLHALTRPWRSTIDDVETHMPKATHDLLYSQQGHEEEQLVDRLSRALVAERLGSTVFRTIDRGEEG
jgi:hypothetical protein